MQKRGKRYLTDIISVLEERYGRYNAKKEQNHNCR